MASCANYGVARRFSFSSTAFQNPWGYIVIAHTQPERSIVLSLMHQSLLFLF